jgi:hypothetical protein
MERYFVDERSGCIAVRDRQNTDPDNNGLHSDTQGVIKYWDGESKIDVCSTCGNKNFHGYFVADDIKQEAYSLCDSLNNVDIL